MGKYQIKKGAKGVSFNLLASNGQVVATSQVYKNERNLKDGAASVAKVAPGAALEDQTAAKPAVEKNPKFEVYKDKGGKIRFRLKAANGQIVAVSEAYETMRAALAGVASVRKNAPDPKFV